MGKGFLFGDVGEVVPTGDVVFYSIEFVSGPYIGKEAGPPRSEGRRSKRASEAEGPMISD